MNFLVAIFMSGMSAVGVYIFLSNPRHDPVDIAMATFFGLISIYYSTRRDESDDDEDD